MRVFCVLCACERVCRGLGDRFFAGKRNCPKIDRKCQSPLQGTFGGKICKKNAKNFRHKGPEGKFQRFVGQVQTNLRSIGRGWSLNPVHSLYIKRWPNPTTHPLSKPNRWGVGPLGRFDPRPPCFFCCPSLCVQTWVASSYLTAGPVNLCWSDATNSGSWAYTGIWLHVMLPFNHQKEEKDFTSIQTSQGFADLDTGKYRDISDHNTEYNMEVNPPPK